LTVKRATEEVKAVAGLDHPSKEQPLTMPVIRVAIVEVNQGALPMKDFLS
jgi:hypothetical protein